MGIPCHPSQKEDGGLRIVVDFRRLNDITVKDPFYMPTIEEIVNKSGYAKLFSKLDLTKGCHQIPILYGQDFFRDAIRQMSIQTTTIWLD